MLSRDKAKDISEWDYWDKAVEFWEWSEAHWGNKLTISTRGSDAYSTAQDQMLYTRNIAEYSRKRRNAS